MLTDRPSCESDPNYQDLVAGRSPHKGIIELIPEPPPRAKIEPAPDAAPKAKTGLRERVSHLFGRRRN